MNVPNVLVHSDQPQLTVDVLKRTHPDLSPAVCADNASLAQCVDKHQPEVVFSCRYSSESFPREVLVETESVKWVSNAGSGVNHLMPWDASKVTVTNTAGVAAGMMAEYALGVMLYFSLDIPGLLTDQADHHWRYREVSPIYGKTLLILGLGKTGQTMAKKAKALDMNVIGVRARVQPTEYVDRVYSNDELHTALSLADFVLVCMPLLDSTKGMIGEREFATMKPGAVLIDVSRGSIVQESALIKALDAQILTGAALDVFTTEPLPEDHPLWDYKNVVISPHCSSVYEGWEKRSAYMFAENLTRWRNGETLLNIVDPARGY